MRQQGCIKEAHNGIPAARPHKAPPIGARLLLRVRGAGSARAGASSRSRMSAVLSLGAHIRLCAAGRVGLHAHGEGAATHCCSWPHADCSHAQAHRRRRQTAGTLEQRAKHRCQQACSANHLDEALRMQRAPLGRAQRRGRAAAEAWSLQACRLHVAIHAAGSIGTAVCAV